MDCDWKYDGEPRSGLGHFIRQTQRQRRDRFASLALGEDLGGAGLIEFGRADGRPTFQPQLIGERRERVMRGFVRQPVRALTRPGALTVLFGEQVGRIGVLQRMARVLASAQVIFLAVVLGTGVMNVGGEVALLFCDLL